jgi:hypothetical protein
VTVIELGQLITPSPGMSSYLQVEEVWGEDPVHLSPKGVQPRSSGSGIPNLWEEVRGERGRAGGMAGGGQEAQTRPVTEEAWLGERKHCGSCQRRHQLEGEAAFWTAEVAWRPKGRTERRTKRRGARRLQPLYRGAARGRTYLYLYLYL